MGKSRTVKQEDLAVDDFEITVRQVIACTGCYFNNENEAVSKCSGEGSLRSLADELYTKHINNNNLIQGVKVSTDNIIFVLKPGIDVHP